MRIISGQHGGRRLLSPPGKSSTRPITSMVKKSVFDSLGERIDDAVVLDLYCGTGTIGLEALSRGAAMCCFAEKDPATLDRLKRNIESMAEDEKSVIWKGDVMRRLNFWLSKISRQVDIAFVDPPYAFWRRQDAWTQMDRGIFSPLANKLSAEGIVLLRTPRQTTVEQQLNSLAPVKSKRYGDMMVTTLGARS